MIVIDSKEKANVGVEKYLIANGVETRREMLVFEGVECGDYTNETRDFLVERKRWDDYKSSLVDGRLLLQCIKMCENFEGPKYVIFEGDFDAMLATLEGNYLYPLAESFPLKLQHVYGISFVKCIDSLEVAEFVMLLDKYASGLTKDHDPRDSVHLAKGKDQRLRPLLSIDRFGEKAAENFLKVYPCIMDGIEDCIFDPIEAIKKVDGLGKGGIDKMNEIFYGTTPIVKTKALSEKQKTGIKKHYAYSNAKYKRLKNGSVSD